MQGVTGWVPSGRWGGVPGRWFAAQRYSGIWRFSRPGSGVTTNSYKSRTTLWDDEDPAGSPAPQVRGAWRAPSAVLAGERGGRRAVVAAPPMDEEEDAPIPRRTNFYASKTHWWRPRTNFGRIVLGTGVFIGACALIAGWAAGRHFVTRDAHFRIPGVSSIESTGLSEVNRTDVLPVFGADIGRNIFFVPLQQRRKELEAIPWVKQATVMRFLPDRLSVSILERTPVAFVRQGQQVELADADGVILDMPPAMMAQHHYSFPVVTGIDSQDSLAARRTRMAVYQRFVAEMDQNNQHMSQQVSEIDLSDPEDLRATMPEQGTDILAHFGEDKFQERMQTYKAHIAEWRQRYPKLIGVDLRYSGKVPLEMASDVPGAETATDGPAKPAIPVPAAAKIAKLPVNKAAASKITENRITENKPVENKKVKGSTPSQVLAVRRATEAKKRAAKLKAERLRLARQKAHAANQKPAASGAKG
ncbi:cell division protein FtsQ/DivIB [Acidicapsa ligni]|uniref:cell division protein FtsQ/DivIB n=1 Tax=Acidicapsa ligni TaxID=542300 RepID=UPI0021E0E0C7|nr:FtsQ-type POTRA domain-containing protein [Acidicapsa ligni]